MLRKRLQRITFTDIVVWAIGVIIAVFVIYGSYVTSNRENIPGKTGST